MGGCALCLRPCPRRSGSDHVGTRVPGWFLTLAALVVGVREFALMLNGRAPVAHDTARLLFIGNSFTARNDVPGLLASLAESRGKALEHRLISAGGASLRMHWNKGEAPREIERTRYDWVVLQEQSTLPVKNARRMHENIRLFDAPIRASGARMALYLTWARAHAPESQAVITDAYTGIAGELGAAVVPVGVAWERVLAKPGHPVLHDKDGSHPTLAGSYLAACVFLAVLFGENPIGIESDLKGVSAGDVRLLQQSAWETAKGGSR